VFHIDIYPGRRWEWRKKGESSSQIKTCLPISHSATGISFFSFLLNKKIFCEEIAAYFSIFSQAICFHVFYPSTRFDEKQNKILKILFRGGCRFPTWSFRLRKLMFCLLYFN
jgi:hypothetical protein